MFVQYIFINLLLIAATDFTHATVSFVPVGCYRDLQENRPLPELIHNYRLNDEMNWLDLNSSVIEPCAQEAHRKNYLYFGIQFYGECWSGPNAHESYMRDGASDSCVAGVGRGFANMVYRLVGEERECEDYKTLDNIDRSISYDTTSDAFKKCDNRLMNGKDWFRFTGPAGNALASSPSELKCQTRIGGYYKGRYPNVTEGSIKTNACFYKNCRDMPVMHVRNCGSFYVYKFSPAPACPLRYCGNGIQSQPITVDIL